MTLEERVLDVPLPYLREAAQIHFEDERCQQEISRFFPDPFYPLTTFDL